MNYGCCYGDEVTPTPTPEDDEDCEDPEGCDEDPPITPSPYFRGYVFNDAEATPLGGGSSDNLCQGNESNPVNNNGGTVSVVRGVLESKAQVLSNASYNINVATEESTYTVSLDLEVNGDWQCACNATIGNSYRCEYTNQAPPSAADNVNFFIKPSNLATNGWFQTFGGNFFASESIATHIPAVTCDADPTCIPALIAPDTAGTVNSPGFPLVDSGSILTSDTGAGAYIHETGTRSSAYLAGGFGVSVPTENYLTFYNKFGETATTLPSASKPTAGAGLHIYRHSGNLTINETHGWNVPNNEQYIVFVSGNLTIDDSEAGENRITTVATGGTGFFCLNCLPGPSSHPLSPPSFPAIISHHV